MNRDKPRIRKGMFRKVGRNTTPEELAKRYYGVQDEDQPQMRIAVGAIYAENRELMQRIEAGSPVLLPELGERLQLRRQEGGEGDDLPDDVTIEIAPMPDWGAGSRYPRRGTPPDSTIPEVPDDGWDDEEETQDQWRPMISTYPTLDGPGCRNRLSQVFKKGPTRTAEVPGEFTVFVESDRMSIDVTGVVFGTGGGIAQVKNCIYLLQSITVRRWRLYQRFWKLQEVCQGWTVTTLTPIGEPFWMEEEPLEVQGERRLIRCVWESIRTRGAEARRQARRYAETHDDVTEGPHDIATL
ncbi:MAG: hypothetical protein AAF721_09260 [Myxococcota bacterium]